MIISDEDFEEDWRASGNQEPCEYCDDLRREKNWRPAFECYLKCCDPEKAVSMALNDMKESQSYGSLRYYLEDLDRDGQYDLLQRVVRISTTYYTYRDLISQLKDLRHSRLKVESAVVEQRCLEVMMRMEDLVDVFPSTKRDILKEIATFANEIGDKYTAERYREKLREGS